MHQHDQTRAPHVRVGLTEAAKLTGKNAATITRARQKGRLSSSQDEHGKALFEVVELERVFGSLRIPEAERTSAAEVQSVSVHRAEERAHEAEKDALRQQLALVRDQLDDLRRDRDHWRQQATALLTDQRPRGGDSAHKEQPPRRFWKSLFGR